MANNHNAIINHARTHGKVTYGQIRALYTTKAHTMQVIEKLVLAGWLKKAVGGVFEYNEKKESVRSTKC